VNLLSKDDIKKSTFKKRLFSNHYLRKKLLLYTLVIWWIVIPFIAYYAYPNSDQICDKSYESDLRVPDWVEYCESHYWDYDDEYLSDLEFVEVSYMLFSLVLIFSVTMYIYIGTIEKPSFEDIRFQYEGIIMNLIMIFVNISILIFNLLTRPKFNAYSEGNIDAIDWLETWEVARFLHLSLPALIYSFGMVIIIKRSESSSNQNKKSEMQIMQVDEVNRKLRLIQPHISKTIIEEIESELYQLNIDLTSETIRNQDLEKTISKLQSKISTLEKSNPQISQNVNITIRDSVVMDASFDNSINNNKQK